MTHFLDEQVEAYKLAHPEIDWTQNDVLFRWDDESETVKPDGYWSIAERDRIYAMLAKNADLTPGDREGV